MQNHWLRKHLNRKQELTIQDNYSPIVLSWDMIEEAAAMPILRNNYMEVHGMWNIYVAGLELERNQEGTERWQTAFTNSLTI